LGDYLNDTVIDEFSSALLFFLIKKVTKKSRQQNASFAAQALALQIRQNHRAEPSSPAPHPQAPLQPEANALPSTQATMFCLISPGSGLLPVGKQNGNKKCRDKSPAFLMYLTKDLKQQ